MSLSSVTQELEHREVYSDKDEHKPEAPVAEVEEDLKAFGVDMGDLDRDDIIMQMKMKLVNDAIDEIGFTWYHVKLFFLSGVGYGNDSLLTLLESFVRPMITYEFGTPFAVSNLMSYAGMFCGSIFWGLSSDLIGRRTAFNMTLFLSGLFTIFGGTMGTFSSYCIVIFLMAFLFGGNLVLDSVTFLEFLPHKQGWLLTFFALFWGIGQVVVAALALAYLPRWSCTEDECPDPRNNGWRYCFYTSGSIVLFLAVARVTVIDLDETPKFLVSNKRDAEAVQVLQGIANKYGRQCSLTVEKLEACGEITSNEDYRQDQSIKGTYRIVKEHFHVLFANRRLARSTTTLWFSWLALGICYPLYTTYLPMYLSAKNKALGGGSLHQTYVDNLIANAVSTGGPMVAGLMLLFFPWLGRRGVMCFGALVTCAFFVGYAFVKTHPQAQALLSLSWFAIFIYYSCLFAYSPEVMPTAARATGNAMAIACTRFALMFVPVIAYYGDPTTLTPVFVCAGIIGLLGLVCLLYPFEPSKQRCV